MNDDSQATRILSRDAIVDSAIMTEWRYRESECETSACH
jgi:hypothetical protein